jgi:hypothetical protein
MASEAFQNHPGVMRRYAASTVPRQQRSFGELRYGEPGDRDDRDCSDQPGVLDIRRYRR